MENAILGFMILVVALCAFTVYVVLRDMIRERKRKQQTEGISKLVEARLELLEAKQEQQQAVTAKEQQDAPSGQHITVEHSVVAIPLEEYEGQIRFSADPKQSHKAKYMALDSVQKAWYDEIAAYANSVEEVKHVTANAYDEYRLFGKRVIRMRIKKGTVICEFIIANPNFSRYVSTNKVAVKQAPTSFKLLEARDVGVAKDSIDIAVRTIQEEREEAKRREKERRRLARQAAVQASSHAAATTTTVMDEC